MNKSILAMMASALMAGGCATQSGEEAKVIDNSGFKPESRHYSIDVLEAFGRVNAPVVSPDGTKVLYGVSYESVEENRSNLDLYVMNVDGSEPKRLTATPDSENGAVWIDGGKRIRAVRGGRKGGGYHPCVRFGQPPEAL